MFSSFGLRRITILLGVASLMIPVVLRAQPVRWQQHHAGDEPGGGAIRGGPGDAPEHDAPLFVCRASYNGSTQPGKWVKGNCNITYRSREIVARSYEVAYGEGQWRPYSGDSPDLLQTGNEADGTPLFSCRVQYRNHGYQPGKLTDGKCDIPYDGKEVVNRGSFEVLYANSGGAYVAARGENGGARETGSSGRKSGVWDKLMENAEYQRDKQAGATRHTDDGSDANAEKEKRAKYLETHACLTTDGAEKANELAEQCNKVTSGTHKGCNIQENTCDEIRKTVQKGCWGLAAEGPDFCFKYR